MKIPIIFTCSLCGREGSIFVEEEDFKRWNSGELPDEVFWYLSDMERYSIVNNVCATCQRDKMST